MHPWIDAFLEGTLGLVKQGWFCHTLSSTGRLDMRILKTGKKILVFNESCLPLIKSLPCNALSEVLDKIAVFKVFPKKVNIVVF